MLKTTTVVVGAGHSGLAMSRCLTDHSIDHVVLERGEVADSWRTQRWDSMRLLTPNWMTRLPGFGYGGDDPDGYLSASEVVQLIEHYGKETGAPVVANTTVTSARRTDEGYVVRTDQDSWHARSIVVASGANAVARIPALQAGVPPGITTLTPADYRNPRELPDGGVLVVGASASGIQIAAELHRAGRRVTLAVGEHVRMPRMYRGRDILWWMNAAGLFDERYDKVPDLVRARGLPSMQLVGSSDRASIDLNSLSAQGVQLVGRLAGIRGGIAQFSGSLPNMFTLADLKLGRLLDTIDAWAVETGWDGGDPPRRYEPTVVHGTVPLTMDLRSGDVRTILWATGFRPDVSWLDVPVFDPKGQIRHDGGVMPSPGLYLMGMPFMRRRKSSFIDGAAADAADLSGHLAHYLGSN
jgi:putative flavoprotein involved in K+ transport